MIPTCLVIGGSDNTGGAGIQADIKTLTVFGVNAMSAVTSVTAQSPDGVLSLHHTSSKLVSSQIKAVLNNFTIAAIKTGMLGTYENTLTVIEALRDAAKRKIPIIVDPVMFSTSGKPLLEQRAMLPFIENVLGLSTLVTPNIQETLHIAESMQIADKDEVLLMFEKPDQYTSLIKKFNERLNTTIIFKGGDFYKKGNTVNSFDQSQVLDFFLMNDDLVIHRKERIKSKSTHGTGCTFASSIAAGIAKGKNLKEAIKQAEQFIHKAISNPLWQNKSYTPVNQLWNYS